MNKIRVSELRKIFDRVLEKIEFEGVEDISIELDLYRHIPANEWTDWEKEVTLVGDLDDDIENLKKLVGDDDRPCTYVDVDRLAHVLIAISHTFNPAS